jgi:PAS domain S-box-containing protein
LLTRTRIRLRLMIAIPAMTTLLVLGLGLIIIDLDNRELLKNKELPVTIIEYSQRIENLLNDTTIWIVGFGVLALFAGLGLAVAITAPIRKLTSDTASIASGDLTRTIHVSGDGEIALLGSAFNNMITTINKYLLQTMSGGVVTINQEGIITSMSADTEVILGINAGELVGMHIKEMIPDTKENRSFHNLIQGTLRNRQTFVGKEMTVTTESRDAIPISISTSFLQDRDDMLIGLIISFEDVKHLRKVQEQMQKLDRLTTLGGLAAGIAHQVRNPLCSIRGLAQLLKENSSGNPMLADYSDVILSDVDRIDRVIDRLLKFIQPSSSGWSYESINEIIDDTLVLAKHEIRKKDIELVCDFSQNLPRILCQRENLIQAFMNILVNAFQAIERFGRVTIRTEQTPDTESGPNGAICVRFTNNGPPIAPEDISRIFEPSFTTKDDGGGYGLAITKQTIEFHSGRIRVESQTDGETAFTVWLPIRKHEIQDPGKVENAESA